MTRVYACKRLLEHGPLTSRQIATIAGWPPRATDSAIGNLVNKGVAVGVPIPGTRRLTYMLHP